MRDALFPGAEWTGDAGRNADGQGWGVLPDRGGRENQIRVVLHTTEGSSLPGYSNGQHAPHLTYDAARRKWYQHGHTNRRMGTLTSSQTTGTLANEISIQVEIISYSDRKLAAQRGGLWVGDFGDEHYADLARFVAWCREVLLIPLEMAYGPPVDFPTFLWGDQPTRMTPADWLDAGGILTAHGAAPGDHWDTGALDLHRIIAESKEGAADGGNVAAALAELAAQEMALRQAMARNLAAQDLLRS